MNILNSNVIGLKPGYNYQDLDEKSGIIKENTEVTENTVIMGMASNSINSIDTYIDNSVYAKKGQVGIVDKSFMTEGEEGKRIAKVRIRGTRIPAIGDKFCSRAGQKGTIGIILPECDMPCTEDGVRPDIIVNPHAMPSRMTIGHLIETLTSKTACVYGMFGDCTAFTTKGPKDKQYGEMLTKEGYHSSGNQILYNGMTGEQLETEIYFGPTYYLRLKHMPKDKINYRAKGPRTVLTRQTVQGRANNGGLRIGEMDRDCLIGHGMSHFVNESMMVRGDQFKVAICNKTGCIAVYNESSNIFLSPMADGPVKFTGNLVDDLNIINVSKYGRDFSIINVPYAFKLLMQELQTMNIQMRIITEDNVDQLMSLTKGDDVEKLTHQRFFNLEQVRNQLNIEEHKLKNKSAPIIKEKTPELEATSTPVWGEEGYEFGNLFSDTESQNNDDKGTDVNIQLEQRKGEFRHNNGDIVVFESDDEPRVQYKIIDFDPEEMKYITQAIEGDSKGKYRDSWKDDLITPPHFSPNSPLYGPDSPGYDTYSKKKEDVVNDQGFREYAVSEKEDDSSFPKSIDTSHPKEEEEGYYVPADFGKERRWDGKNAFTHQEFTDFYGGDKEWNSASIVKPDDFNKEVEKDLIYERDLGSADKKEEADNILKTVSSLNDDKINKDLNLLTPMKEDDKSEVEKEDDSSKIKKIN